MNSAAEKFLNDYMTENGLVGIKADAWQFGTEPDKLGKLVVKGVKRGTCSLHKLYDKYNESLPKIGDYDVILNSNEEPIAITKTTKLEIVKMKDVSEEFALSEGEGTYEDWWNEHLRFFTELAEEECVTFSPDDLLVCVNFEVVKTKYSYKPDSTIYLKSE